MSSQLLKTLKEGDLSDSGTLEHLVNLVRSTVQNKSQLNGLSNIQIFSYYLRKNKFQFKQYLEHNNLAQKVNKAKQYDPYVTKVQQIINKVNKNNDNRAYQRPQLMQQYSALKTAGISIGQTNCFHLNKVLKSISIQNQTKSIRFWGKILGYKDYYIIQGVSSKAYLNDLPDNGEKYGQGVNTYSYWVSTDILGNWTELPLVTPQQISGSKTFKYIFTGNLQTQVKKSLHFEGQEKHLLKCIVARITHSCQLAPKGMYKPNQQNPTQIDFQEQYKLPQIAQMNSLDSWVHLNPNILLQGRCSYYIDPKIPQDQRETLNAQLAEKDPIIQRLKGITQDKPYQALGYAANWVASINGQTVPVNQIGKQEGTSLIYGVATLRNLVWPGATTVGYRGGWANIYVGYGHRVSQQYSAIRQLKDLQTQAQQKTQRSQPNPSKAPVEKKQQVAVEVVEPAQ